jgi:DNA-binding NarL/FixJ family response regulator
MINEQMTDNRKMVIECLTKTVNVDIAEDHKMFAECVTSKLKELSRDKIATINEDDIFDVKKEKIILVNVVNNYCDLKSCRLGLEQQLPDILLLDIGMPDGDGVEFCAEITKKYDQLKVIILTGYKEYNIIKHAQGNGAFGYVLKSSDTKELYKSIEAASLGTVNGFMCEEVKTLIDENEKTKVIYVTKIERKILELFSEGLKISQIGKEFDPAIAMETVKSHLRNIRRKFAVQTTPQAVEKAKEMKLISPSSHKA